MASICKKNTTTTWLPTDLIVLVVNGTNYVLEKEQKTKQWYKELCPQISNFPPFLRKANVEITVPTKVYLRYMYLV